MQDSDHDRPLEPVREIAEKMLSYHTDGTVIATAEVLKVDVVSLWAHFVQHLNPELLARTSDEAVMAYLYIKCFEDWCMEQLSDSYNAETSSTDGHALTTQEGSDS